MSFLDGLLGAGASAAILGGYSIQPDHSMNAERDRQVQAYNAAISKSSMTKLSPWVFNSKPCSLQEFADCVWGTEEHPDKMLFLLTHSGPEQK